jgi:hypothetical protein
MEWLYHVFKNLVSGCCTFRNSKSTKKLSVPAGSKQAVVMQESSKKLVQQDSSHCHYDSDTETETTDDERKVDTSFLSDTDDLLNDDKTTFSNIPKHINLRKRHIVEVVAGPSSRKVSGGAVASGCDEEFSVQDMLNDM